MKLVNATREYVANKQATGMVFEAEACILRTFTEQLGANVAINVSRLAGASVAVGRDVRVGIGVGSKAMPAELFVTKYNTNKTIDTPPNARAL